MRKFKLLLVLLVSVLSLSAFGAVAALANEDTQYTKEVAEENNLATNKYDWITDNVASGSVVIDDEGMTFENFNMGSSVYALYQTETFSEFKYSMYANLNLTRPSELGYDYTHDYSNLYISFQINSQEPIAATTCPWNGNKANFSICFENLQGHSKVVLYLNGSIIGDGTKRQIVAEAQNVDWNDGEYHWYELEFVNEVREVEVRGQIKEYAGKTVRFYFDGELCLEYFQRNDRFLADAISSDYLDYNFTETKGYLGFWPSSDFPGGINTVDTNCFVNIKTIEITSLDDGNETPYEKCPVPDFPINSVTYSPDASYETELDIEIKVSDLFSYEGDGQIEYTAICNNEDLGAFRNGYWVWCPTEAGEYIVTVTATVGDKSATNYLILNVVDAAEPIVPGEPESVEQEESKNSSPSSAGCTGGMSGVAILSLLAVSSLAILRGKRK